MGGIILSNKIILKNVLYILEFKVNLIAISKLALNNSIIVNFNSENCDFLERKKNQRMWLDRVAIKMGYICSTHLPWKLHS